MGIIRLVIHVLRMLLLYPNCLWGSWKNMGSWFVSYIAFHDIISAPWTKFWQYLLAQMCASFFAITRSQPRGYTSHWKPRTTCIRNIFLKPSTYKFFLLLVLSNTSTIAIIIIIKVTINIHKNNLHTYIVLKISIQICLWIIMNPCYMYDVKS